MEKVNCVVCGNPFAFRKGKMYCSDSCKTKAHEKRKAGLPITGEAMRPKGSALSFDVKEYEVVKKLLRVNALSLDLYCFFRKNLPITLSVERINVIMDEYYQNCRFDSDGAVHSSLQSAFSEFQKNFFSGTFEIIDSSTQAA